MGNEQHQITKLLCNSFKGFPCMCNIFSNFDLLYYRHKFSKVRNFVYRNDSSYFSILLFWITTLLALNTHSNKTTDFILRSVINYIFFMISIYISLHIHKFCCTENYFTIKLKRSVITTRRVRSNKIFIMWICKVLVVYYF